MQSICTLRQQLKYIDQAEKLAAFMTHSDELVNLSKEFLNSLESDKKLISRAFP